MTLSILLAEDNANIRDHLLDIMAAGPFRVDVAGDGLEALNTAKAGRYDVLVLDHKMPLMDGLRLTQNIRALANYQETPIVLLTTGDWQTVNEKSVKAGATACLAKPVMPEQLLQLLKRLGYGEVA